MSLLDRQTIYQIAYYLDIPDILKLEQCCQRLQKLFNDDRSTRYFWRYKAYKMGIIRNPKTIIPTARVRCVGVARMVKWQKQFPGNEDVSENDLAQQICLENNSSYQDMKEALEHAKHSLGFDDIDKYEFHRLHGWGRQAGMSITDPRLGLSSDLQYNDNLRDIQSQHLLKKLYPDKNFKKKTYKSRYIESEDQAYLDARNPENNILTDDDHNDIMKQLYENPKTEADVRYDDKAGFEAEDERVRQTQIVFKLKSRSTQKVRRWNGVEIDVLHRQKLFHLAAIDLQKYHERKKKIVCQYDKDGCWIEEPN